MITHALTILNPSSLAYFLSFPSFFGLSSSSLGASFFCEYFFSSNPPGNFSSLTSISLNFGPVAAVLFAFTNLGGGFGADCSSLAFTCDYSSYFFSVTFLRISNLSSLSIVFAAFSLFSLSISSIRFYASSCLISNSVFYIGTKLLPSAAFLLVNRGGYVAEELPNNSDPGRTAGVEV